MFTVLATSIYSTPGNHTLATTKTFAKWDAAAKFAKRMTIATGNSGASYRVASVALIGAPDAQGYYCV